MPVFLMCLFPFFAANDLSAASMDRDLRLFMEGHNITGMTISLVKDGKPVYVKAFGIKSKRTGKPVTVDSVFQTASISKPFVATAIMQLVETGKVALDDPIVRFLPYFRIDSDDYHKLTLRHFLTHTAGMPDVEDYEWEKPQHDAGAAERYVRSLTSQKPIGPPGRFRYSNMTFDILADVVAKVSGVSFEDYVKTNILEPLEMNNSTFLYPQVPENLRTSPHHVDNWKVVTGDVYPYNRRHAPSSTLHSTAADLARWGMANLAGGVLDGRRILQKESYGELWKKQVSEGKDSWVGLSWFIDSWQGLRLINHSGGVSGYRSYFGMLPEKGIAVAILCNYEFAPVNEIRDYLLRAALGWENQPIKKPIMFALIEPLVDTGPDAAVARYRELAANHSDAYDFSLPQLQQLGYFFLDDNRVDDAIALFRLNVEAFPKHSSTQGNLGEAYMIKGENNAARKHLEKSIALDPGNSRSKQILDKLLEKQSNQIP